MNSQKDIIYLTSSHYANDDRIYYHFKASLEKHNYKLHIRSSFDTTNDHHLHDTLSIKGFNLSRKEKLNWFLTQLIQLKPSIIICGEPLPILAAKKFKKQSDCKIIYDVTEWYPSKKNLENISVLKKIAKGTSMFLLNTIASFFVDGFIIGEYHKKRLYDFLYPLKPKKIISYYAKEKFLSLKGRRLQADCFTVGYSGRFNKEKGLSSIFEISDSLRKQNPELNINLSLIGKTFTQKDELELKELQHQYSSLNINILPTVPFEEFGTSISSFDVALDLRNLDWENNRCLPIKVFHYNGCGIPVLYTNLDAIKKGYKESDFCKLINPNELEAGVAYIQNFINNKELYHKVSLDAVTCVKNNYTWESIENNLIGFIEKINVENK